MAAAAVAVGSAVAVGFYVYSEHGDEIAELARDGAEGLVEVCQSIEQGVRKCGEEAKADAIILFHGVKNATKAGKEELSNAFRTSFIQMREDAGDLKRDIDEIVSRG